MREKGIVADYLRHPNRPVNVAIETLLVAADAALREGDYSRQTGLLEEVDRLLRVHEGIERIALILGWQIPPEIQLERWEKFGD
jgi:hypothetical protein